MKATEQLKSEHQAVLLMLQVLERMSEKFKHGEEVNLGHLDQVLEFLKGFVDRCHHAKEEELLFPEMEKAGIDKVDGPINVMLSEHSRGREYIRSMNESADKFRLGDEAAISTFITSAEGYIKLLRQHIIKGPIGIISHNPPFF